MRYLIKIAYDGSKCYGFQKLNNQQTVQNEIERCLSIINKKPVTIKGAGRTDRGVHAFGQRAHFDLDISIHPQNLIFALNRILVDHVRILDCQEVDNNFHARFMVKKKSYEYHIYCRKDNPLLIDYAYCYDYKFNIRKMRKAAKLMSGSHNYINFVSGPRNNYEAIVDKIKVVKSKKEVIITFTGKSFYRYMIRNMVGALIEVGQGKKDLEYINDLLNKSNIDCTKAPANGLYLMEVEY